MPVLSARNAYRRILQMFPDSVGRRVDENLRAVFRPTVGKRSTALSVSGFCVEPWMFGAKAAVCISADFELAWAARYASLEKAMEDGRRTRRYFGLLLATFAQFNVPVTWAAVGHLFLRECSRDGVTGVAHPEMPRPRPYRNRSWTFPGGDWYEYDPCTSVSESPEWYAPDLLAQIIRSEVHHEVGSHSFSHTDFSEGRCPKALALSELKRSREEASHMGIDLRSFVFPGNLEGNHDALREAGFLAYRGSAGPNLAYPSKTHGLWNIPGSLQLFDPSVDYRRRLPRYLDVAARTGTCCHLSFHPSAPDSDSVRGVLVPALTILHDREDQGEVWNATMGEIAGYCEARSLVKVRSGGARKWRVNWGIEDTPFNNLTVTLSCEWRGSVPQLEVDGNEVPPDSKDCFVRDDTLFVTLRFPSSSFVLSSR
jgi:peptidoglycan/xylan/chitin deacetylase (PgdA/CDA1 family)